LIRRRQDHAAFIIAKRTAIAPNFSDQQETAKFVATIMREAADLFSIALDDEIELS